jgi:hypothetical protein
LTPVKFVVATEHVGASHAATLMYEISGGVMILSSYVYQHQLSWWNKGSFGKIKSWIMAN